MNFIESDRLFDWADNFLDPIGEYNQLMKYFPDNFKSGLVECQTVHLTRG
jgi:hypothetical protein